MTVHNLYIFDRNGSCLHYSEWNRKKQAGISQEEEFKLMYGMLFSIRSFISKMSPLDMYPSLLSVFTLVTVSHLQLYVEYIVKNPLCVLGESLQSDLFNSKLDSFIRALPFFSVRAA
uniref:Trafficking protein particle complex subunit n=1 Tax=Sinocyclocheilus rhinocerous TaxID=307959 RepID=A0A673JMD0_9TELE